MSLDWLRFLVAESNDGHVIGCGQIKPHQDGSQELASIAVTEDWRGKGVARAIIEALMTGHDGELYLTCRSSLGALYEKFGFYEVEDPADMPRYFRRISKVVGIVVPLLRRGERLLVMKRR
jgi:N-acetylglutamate synthase-like GNAT family acetyltransferase